MRKYRALDIARWFLTRIDRDAGDSITHLKLQKLVYYAQAWSLAILERPLFDEDLEAWAHGPVAETVWQKYRDSGWDAIPPPKENLVPVDDDALDILEDVHLIYGDLSAKRLERMTHSELPWREARGNLPPEARSNTKIRKDTMATYYRGQLEKA